MGLREKLNENRGVSIGLAVVMLLGGVAALMFTQGGSGGVNSQAFFTVDDGQTLFADDIRKLPPFDKSGQNAVRAHVYSCDGGKTRFVGYLQRYTPAARQKLQSAIDAGQPADRLIGADDIEFKKPGQGAWISQKDPAKAAAVRNVACPHNAGHTPTMLDPS